MRDLAVPSWEFSRRKIPAGLGTAALGLAGVFALFFLAAPLLSAVFDAPAAAGVGLDPSMNLVFGLCMALFFWPGLYLFNRRLAGRSLGLELPGVVLYMGVTLVAGLVCEIGWDSLWVAVFGEPLWLYRTWPLRGGYTTGVAFVQWPLYGFHVCCLHRALAVNPSLAFLNNNLAKGVFIGVDAMAIEFLVNSFSLGLFGSYHFYYFPPDLAHFTSIQVFLPYVASGIGGMYLLGALEKRKSWRAPVGLGFAAAGLAAMAVGL
ncbi:MAG: hypothetical protein KKA60_06455 [Proteobacteria bacterium]|nr:hypothetical protein [Pseudomonadota bacterium]